jgi:DNA polymerase III gamma/tau subunit
MTLITHYRPKNWDELIGNDALVNSIRTTLIERNSQAYLISGPSGCGKTTIARLASQDLHAEDENIIDVNAAVYNGVDDMRELIETINYKPLRGTAKCIIVDECQAITAQAWRALFKSVEEPPSWVFWFFCTTELNKVPVSIKNRCSLYQVSLLKFSELKGLVNTVALQESKLIQPEVLALCASRAEGSPRRALANLAQISEKHTLEEARELLCSEGDEPDSIIQFTRALIERVNWRAMQPMLKRLKDENPETIRRIVEAYVTKVILDSDGEFVARGLVPLLTLFAEPITGTSLAPIVRAAALWILQSPTQSPVSDETPLGIRQLRTLPH